MHNIMMRSSIVWRFGVISVALLPVELR